MNPKNPINRRLFLRGLGAAVALPYLDIMGGATVADKLKDIRAADGTLLDHTVLLLGGA